MRPMSKTEAYITLSIKEAANNGQTAFSSMFRRPSRKIEANEPSGASQARLPVTWVALVMSHGYDFDSLLGDPIDDGEGESGQ